MVWSLGIARGPDPFNVIYRGPIQTGQDALDFGDRVLFIADPFLFIHEKRWFIFTEALNNDCQKGEIAYHLSTDSGSTWSYGGIILKEDWHLSFPFVVSHEDAFYMITCATAGTQSPYSLWLYSTNSLPNGWKRVSKILQNQTIGRPVDPILLNKDGFWYLFVLDDGIDKEKLFYSASLLGPFTEHTSSRRYLLRHSGRIVKDRTDKLWAFHHTSKSVERKEIEVLTTTEYKYGKSRNLLGPTRDAWSRSGMHTFNAVEINPDDWVVVVDGFWQDKHFKTFKCVESGRLSCQVRGLVA